MKKITLLFLVLSGLLFAQDPAPQNTISLTFKIVGFKFGRNDLFIKRAKGFTPLTVEANCVSTKTYAYTGPVDMPVYRQVKTPDKITYDPVASVTFPLLDPKQTGRFLLIFSGSKANVFTVSVVADDTASFPLQTVRVINAMSATAGVMVNKNSGMIPPGQSQLFHVQNAVDDRVEIHVAVQHRDRWIEANNNVFAVDKTSRRTVFIVNNTAPNTPPHQPPAIGFLSLADQPDDKPVPVEEEPAAP